MSKDNDVEATSGDHQHHYTPPPQPPPQQQYPPPQKGTFQVVSNNSPAPQPVVGDPSAPKYPLGYAVAEGMPVREPPLACGIGFGWILFILGFLLGLIPWYIGAIILLCSKIDRREKPGCIACTVAAAVGTILAIVIIATNGATHYLDH